MSTNSEPLERVWRILALPRECQTSPAASAAFAPFCRVNAAGLLNSTYEFSFNTVQRAFGIDLADGPESFGAPTTASSKMLIRNNVFSGPNGVFLEATFAGGTQCCVVANNFQQVTDTGVRLGPGTSHCVVAGNTQTTIVNLGTNNVVVNGGRR